MVEKLEGVRVINKYTLGDVKEEYYKKALYTIFSELTVDNVYEEEVFIEDGIPHLLMQKTL